MKLLSFELNGLPRLGVLAADGGIIDLAKHNNHHSLSSMQALIEAGAEGLLLVRQLLEDIGESIDPASVRWLAPLPQPVQLRDFLVFEEHMSIAGWRGAQLRAKWGAPPAPLEPMPIPPIWYEQPIYYKCNRMAVAGPDTEVTWPKKSSIIDYELEIACIIGKGGKDIAASDAGAHIFGFTIFNDLTARDLQFREMQGPLGPAKGKDFDNANILGPVIVTADEVGTDPDLAMRGYINDELWSEGRSGSMHWSWGQIIEHVSRGETLHPGEILGSGTVGSGCGLELGRLLQNRDVIRLEIDGIGSLVTTINAPHVTERTLL